MPLQPDNLARADDARLHGGRPGARWERHRLFTADDSGGLNDDESGPPQAKLTIGGWHHSYDVAMLLYPGEVSSLTRGTPPAGNGQRATLGVRYNGVPYRVTVEQADAA